MSTLTRDMVLDRTRLLAPVTRRALAEAARPYATTSETAAAYVEAAALLNDDFDMSGMPDSFCQFCEHDPCVAEYRRVHHPGKCGLTPRTLNVARVTYPIHAAADHLTEPAKAVYEAMSVAVYVVQATATVDPNPYTRAMSLNYLVKIRDDMRRAVAS